MNNLEDLIKASRQLEFHMKSAKLWMILRKLKVIKVETYAPEQTRMARYRNTGVW